MSSGLLSQESLNSPAAGTRALLAGLLLCLFVIISPAVALPSDVIGHIQTLQGTASVVRGNATLPAAKGDAVYSTDLLRTSGNGSMGIVLADETTITLGPNSELVVKDFVFDPKEGRFSFLARMVRGTFIYLSGLIGKLAPDSILLEIPDATIAVRGTKLLIEVRE